MPVIEVHEAPVVICRSCEGSGRNAGGVCRACGGSGRWRPKFRRHPWNEKAKAHAAAKRHEGGA
jgi:ribosomal protein L40E